MISPKWNAFNVGTVIVILKRLSLDKASLLASNAILRISQMPTLPSACNRSYLLCVLGTTRLCFQSLTLIN